MKKRDPLLDAWWACVTKLHRPNPPLELIEETYAEWRGIWQKIVDLDPVKIRIDTVSAMATSGAHFAQIRSKPEEGLAIMKVYFDHPEVAADNYISHIQARAYKAEFLYLTGESSKALEIIRADLERPQRKEVRSALWSANFFVSRLIGDRPDNTQPDPRLTVLVREIVRLKWPSKKYWERVAPDSNVGDLKVWLSAGWYTNFAYEPTVNRT